MLKRTSKQLSMFSSLEDMLSHQHPLFQLSNKINWERFENAFPSLYCNTNGRPAHPIRLMCGLLILKHLRNVSDEMVVFQWSENAYYQYFCGGLEFMPKQPCDASELVHFRNRIGEEGMELILAESIRVNTDYDNEDAINVLLAAAAYNFKRAMRILLYLIKRISIELVSTSFMLKYSF